MFGFRIIALAATLMLGGCVTDGIGTALDAGIIATTTVANPVTNEQQAGVELAYFAAAEAAVTYARLPRCKSGQVASVTAPCSSWAVVQKIKTVNRAAYAALTALRRFMDTNQQISAVSAFNAAVKALQDFRAIAYINNIPVPNPA